MGDWGRNAGIFYEKHFTSQGFITKLESFLARVTEDPMQLRSGAIRYLVRDLSEAVFSLPVSHERWNGSNELSGCGWTP